MLDATPDDIAALNDKDLRELVARLCEAELASSGRSTVAVTWGGSQTAPDGGLDVRVSQKPGSPAGGFIPRPSTGYQVKLPDMPPSEILAEMRPNGVIRPVIAQLASEGGAYLIVSSKGSVADIALNRRREAMREALKDVADGDRLLVDFYDRARLASWVRQYPGLVAWVGERLNRHASGWHGFGAWSYPAEGVSAEYLTDDKLRLSFGRQDDGAGRTIGSSLDDLRDMLRDERKVVRLVGLSGVGKTRLVQALFDARIGARPLPQALPVYTNMSDDPSPQPVGMATEIIAAGHRAILIVDNCTPELHRRLTEVCQAPDSKLSVLTVEYDVRDDQPEGTHVVSLDTSSQSLIATIVRRRFPHISAVDAATIAEASGGNARIAIALANTVANSESIAGLSDEELFRRLFQQRHDPSESLLRAAKACSLLYSFEGEALDGANAELPRLAAIARQDPVDLYGHVSELLRRELVQQRASWRAVLPHAIANRLAKTALEDLPLRLIEDQLVTAGTRRTLKSFSRRLSFLHDHPKAVEIATKWLAPGGILASLKDLDDDGVAILGNVAPIMPGVVLDALARLEALPPEEALAVWRRERTLLRSLAYDPMLFDRSAWLMARSCTEEPLERVAKLGVEAFVSLFTVYLSGTHASIDQRLAIVERLLRASDDKKRALGLLAVEKLLQTSHFSSGQKFEFGAHSRAYGSAPRTDAEISTWFGAILAFVERLLFADGLLQDELKLALSKHFRSLWRLRGTSRALDSLARRIAAAGFWREGWLAVKLALAMGKREAASADLELLKALEIELRPENLIDQVRALVLGESSGTFDLDENSDDAAAAINRGDVIAKALGEQVAADAAAFAGLLFELLKGGRRAWQFGEGLCAAAADRRLMWSRLAASLARLPVDSRNPQVMRGFVAHAATVDRALADELLDASLADPLLSPFLPWLQSAVDLDQMGIARLKDGLVRGGIPVGSFRALMYGGITGSAPADDLALLLLEVAARPGGWRVAIEILDMRCFSDDSAKRPHEERLLSAGRELLRNSQFDGEGSGNEHRVGGVVEKCLAGDGGPAVASELAARLKRAVASNDTYALDQLDVISALLKTQPHSTLDAFFEGDERSRRAGTALFDHLDGHRTNPLNFVARTDLVAWCQADAPVRFALLAESVDLSAPALDGDGSPRWSEQARTLLEACPTPEAVLEGLVGRFRPRSWRGSRAAVMEANGRLLDDLPAPLLPRLATFAAQARERLAVEVEEERQLETRLDRADDERFE